VSSLLRFGVVGCLFAASTSASAQVAALPEGPGDPARAVPSASAQGPGSAAVPMSTASSDLELRQAEPPPAGTFPAALDVQPAGGTLVAGGLLPAPSPSGQRTAAPRTPVPPRYSLPWALRPVIPVNVFRLDNAIAFYRRSDTAGYTVALMPLLGYKFSANFMGLVRWGLVGNSPADANLSGAVSVANPLLGGIYGVKLPASFRLAFFLGVTVPIGTGGYGDAKTGAGDPNVAAATQAGLLARSAMDNVLFAVNDVSVVPGFDLAYVGHRLTFQAEVTLLQLMRVKNEATQPDAFRTNSTFGLHVGCYATGWLSLAAELRYQRWLSTPVAVENDTTGVLRHNLSLALGPRFHVKTGRGWFRPSIAYAVGLLGVMSRDSYHLILLDFPYAL